MRTEETQGVPGTQGYAQRASELLKAWSAIPAERSPAPVLALMKAPPGRAIDVGAGSGRLSAWLARRGWSVSAVEPTAPLRDGARRLHPSPSITWIDDALPDLAGLGGDGADLVLCVAVLSHLEPCAQARAMDRLAELVAPGGRLVVSLRTGPPGPGRTGFPADPRRLAGRARAAGLTRLFDRAEGAVQRWNRASGVSWRWLAFERRRADG